VVPNLPAQGVLTLVWNQPYQAFIIFYYLYSILGHKRLLQQVNLRFKTKILVYFTVTKVETFVQNRANLQRLIHTFNFKRFKTESVKNAYILFNGRWLN